MNIHLEKISRLMVRLLVLLLALARNTLPRGAAFPTHPKKILILHSLLLGDTLLLTPLLAKLRQQHPKAIIKLTVPAPLLSLYETHPYDVSAIPFHAKKSVHILHILKSGPYDLVIIPAENRLSLLARASGSRHTVAFADDHPAWKNWMVDTAVQPPQQPEAIGDIFTTLIPGNFSAQYNPTDWHAPKINADTQLDKRSILMHLTASMQTKMWPLSHWLELAKKLKNDGYTPYWSIAPGEEQILSIVDPESLFPYVALKFAPMWHILEHATLLISVDTSIVHLARLTQTPTIAIYGPTEPRLFGDGNFWYKHASRAIFRQEVSCRDDHNFFRRPLSWVNICTRDRGKCSNPKCINSITVNDVYNAAMELLASQEST